MEFTSVESIATEVTENAVTEPIGVTVETEESHMYHITADSKKRTYQHEHWTKDINGKKVTLSVYTYFYWGIFEITLTDKEKEEILKKESIILNDYNVSCEEMDSACEQWEDIENEESYTEEELLKINQFIYRPVADEDYDSDKDDEEYEYNEDVLRKNGWHMDDTIYGLDTGCELELISVESTATEVTENAETEPTEEPTENAETEESHIYELTADYKKCTYQTEQWNNVLSNGKRVRFEVTNYFYWGKFEIELTDKEKEEILKKDSIILNDHSCVSVESLDSGCDYSDEICNEDSYTKIERREIHRLLYFDRYHQTSYTSDCDDIDEDILELNGWSMDDTIYGMDTGCELTLISD
jgi:hypothetical protein